MKHRTAMERQIWAEWDINWKGHKSMVKSRYGRDYVNNRKSPLHSVAGIFMLLNEIGLYPQLRGAWEFQVSAGCKPTKLNLFYDGTRVAVALGLK
jgi:hypothetical protein